MPTVSPARIHLIIFVLAIGSFGIGMTEFATMGLMSAIAQGMNVTLATAGNAVSSYALGVVVGAPLITVLAAKLDRKILLISLMGIFVLGNALVTLSPNFPVMVIARFISGLPHGVYLGLGAVVAAHLSPKNRQGSAMARVMLGLTVSNIFGVPAATAIGTALGWRSVYGIVTAIGLITLIALIFTLPRINTLGQSSMRLELRTLKRPQVILTLIAGGVGFGGMFAVYTYVEPTMTDLAGLPGNMIPFVLALYGVGMTAGSFVAGWLVDKSTERASIVGIVILLGVMLAIGLGGHIPVIALTGLFLMGIGGSTFTTALQARLMNESPDAPSLTAAMNHAAFNFANALGAILASTVIAAGLGYRAPALSGAVLTVFGLAFTLVAVLNKRRSPERKRTSVAV